MLARTPPKIPNVEEASAKKVENESKKASKRVSLLVPEMETAHLEDQIEHFLGKALAEAKSKHKLLEKQQQPAEAASEAGQTQATSAISQKKGGEDGSPFVEILDPTSKSTHPSGGLLLISVIAGKLLRDTEFIG